MLETQPKDASQQQVEEEDTSPPKIAWVARNRSGADAHNTLTPHWEFAFSV